MKSFLFVLSAVFLAACSQPASAPTALDESPDATAPAGFSQEDADFGLRLALLEGHLMIGRELIQAGQTENALPHFGHPVRELYGDIRPVIAARNGEQLEGDLVRLEALAALKPNTEEFNAAYQAVMTKVAAARALIPEGTLTSLAYCTHLASDVAATASQEYRNALVAGRIDSLIEYHDARGFIFYATDLLAAYPQAPAGVREALARLHTFVAPLNPPNPPLATDTQFEAQASAVREAAR